METRLHAEQIYDYMVHSLANGVEIKKEDKKEMIDEIVYLIDNS